MDWRLEDHMPSEGDDGRRPWFNEGEDMFAAAQRHVSLLNEAARADCQDGSKSGFILVLLSNGSSGAMDVPESVPSAVVESLCHDIASNKDVYGFIMVAFICTRRPSRTDHITKQLLMGEMNMDDLRPEDKRMSLVVFLTTKDQHGVWINNFLKNDDKSGVTLPDRVELEPSETMLGDDWKTFYAKSLNFWKMS
jgi:hypothetical protein